MITIITPTYNRAYILPAAFESLKRQTCFDFEWIVVDDGSADGTSELVSAWQQETLPFSLVFHRQPNGGKHRAVNRGVELARYDHVLILDSDDYLTDDAVEKIHRWIAAIDGLDGFAGVVGFRGKKDGRPLGRPMTADYLDITSPERRKYGLGTDKAEVFRTDILRQFPFPEFEGENFLRESASWDRIAQAGYRLRYYPDVIYIGEYIADGLTKNVDDRVYVRNFQGFTYCTRLGIQTHGFPFDCLRIAHYRKVAKLLQLSDRQICENLNITAGKLLVSRILSGMKNTIFAARRFFHDPLSKNRERNQ